MELVDASSQVNGTVFPIGKTGKTGKTGTGMCEEMCFEKRRVEMIVAQRVRLSA
jgi:hypothetical protein